MKHVTFTPKYSGGAPVAVHILVPTEPATITWCGEPVFDPDKKFDGKLVSRVFESNKPATCKRCRGRLLVSLRKEMGELTLPQLEKVAATFGYRS